jgi:uncharacterized membrane protein YeaQ/YmgE (transglycosylase-associated protein family)
MRTIEGKNEMITLCLWLLAGVLAASAASRLSSALAPDDIVVNSIAGILGALLGGVVFLIFDITPLHALNLWGFVIALVGAVIAISLVRLVAQRLV